MRLVIFIYLKKYNEFSNDFEKLINFLLAIYTHFVLNNEIQFISTIIIVIII